MSNLLFNLMYEFHGIIYCDYRKPFDK